MRKRQVGLLFGMEDTFPWAVVNAINARGGDRVEAKSVEVSYLKDDGIFPYDLILDRISHEIPFYRTYLKCAAASGVKPAMMTCSILRACCAMASAMRGLACPCKFTHQEDTASRMRRPSLV